MQTTEQVISEAWDSIQLVLREVNLNVKIVRQKYEICRKCIRFIQEASECGDRDSEELKAELETLGKTCRPLVNGYMAKVESLKDREDHAEVVDHNNVIMSILKLFVLFKFPVDLESPSFQGFTRDKQEN